MHSANSIIQYYLTLKGKPLLTDSRTPIGSTEAVFFAIKGKNHNGHNYIGELYEKGIRTFVIDSMPRFDVRPYPDALFIKVSSAVAGLQKLAGFHRQQFNIPVIGITGSNGKTIVKEWLAQLLQQDFPLVKSPKSYNSQVGVPLSVWQLKAHHKLGIFEAGISHPGEMLHLESVIHPTIGVFTNIGTAHDEGFDSRIEKIQEKLKLFSHAKTLIYCSDHEMIAQEIERFRLRHTVDTFSWGRAANAYVHIADSETGKEHTILHLHYSNKTYALKIPFTDEVFVENAMHCVTVMLHLGYAFEVIEKRLARLAGTHVAMRLELKRGANDCVLIDDTYNNDLAGLSVALNFLNQHQQKPRKTVILSDVLETGLSPEELYRQIAALLTEKNVNKLVGIGAEMGAYQSLFEVAEKHFFPDTETFIQSYKSAALPAFNHESILVKGARKYRFETIIHQLQEKLHGTQLLINLEALVHNLNFYRSRLKPDTKIMVMVKAFAYGSGSFEVANLLQYHKVDYLAVAYTDEGVALRENGTHVPIMVMNPSPETFDKLVQYNLEPEIYSMRLLRRWIDFLGTGVNTAVKIHLKIDTGMHRLGFQEEDMEELTTLLLQHKDRIHIASAFTHLSGADEARYEEFSLEQLQLFTRLSHQLEEKVGYHFLKHALNSAGIVRFPDHQMNMVRLGIGLYGVEANGLLQEQLQVVGTLKTTISQIKHIKKGETIGYSRKGVALEDTVTATLAIGYADGFNRRLGNGVGKVWINGGLAPVIGNVCMDMCMVDITGIDVQEGDEVIVFGRELPIREIAQALGTIPYEVLTSVGDRVKRVFYTE